ncbi:MAG: DUF1003 domain-containing protein [Actinobacteria bacterium]|nr:DUF1003 domain-containing protein [Actinomycetota bacterium]
MATEPTPSDGHCTVCGRTGRTTLSSLLPGSVIATIKQKHPEWFGDGAVCDDCVDEAKAAEMEALLGETDPEMRELDAQVIDSIRSNTLLSTMNDELVTDINTGEGTLATHVTAAIASWWFPAGIVAAIAAWAIYNIAARPYEPFPLVSLAVVGSFLATLAALEVPFIIRAQRWQRQQAKIAAENDYRLNLKAELEIRYLDEKLDVVLETQARMLETIERLERNTPPFL